MKIRTLLTLGLLLATAACSKLTLENYDKIEAGMSYEEVVALIGSPTECGDVLGVRSCTWGDETRFASVSFVGGKVVLFVSSNLK